MLGYAVTNACTGPRNVHQTVSPCERVWSGDETKFSIWYCPVHSNALQYGTSVKGIAHMHCVNL